MKKFIAMLMVLCMVFGLVSGVSAMQNTVVMETNEGGCVVRMADGEAVVMPEQAELSANYSVVPAANLQKLSTPTNLQWGWAYGWMAENAGGSATAGIAVPGMSSWSAGPLTQGNYHLVIYNAANDANVAEMRYVGYTAPIMSIPLAIQQDLPSGTYYFTVQAEGDGIRYANSDIARSGNWTYTKPAASLRPVTATGWNWPEARWTASSEAYALCYDIEYYYARTLKEEPMICGSTYGTERSSTSEEIYDWPIEEYGSGYYYYRVRVWSKDITKYCNSAWTAISAPYYLSAGAVGDTLNDILNADAADVREEVQKMDTQDLKDALLADDNSNVSDLLADLEEKVGGPATVEADPGFDAVNPNEVSIVGANLNTTGDNKATLNIGAPEEEHVLEEQYSNSVAFSMNLEGVDDQENLAVPVKITMPVPESINPNFLTILHYKQDGTVETLSHPHIFEDWDGKTYVSFVITSFSDFVMAERAYMSGDINGDGEVTTKDVTALRRYIAGGYDVQYIEAALDVNGDGVVTTKDVTMLRRYNAGGYGVEL